jgi:hypothetical protein
VVNSKNEKGRLDEKGVFFNFRDLAVFVREV